MIPSFRQKLLGDHEPVLNRFLVLSAVLLVVAVVGFVVYYNVASRGGSGPGLVDQQIAQLEDAVRSEPDSFEARVALATTYEAAHRYSEAIEQYQMALQIEPESTDATMGLARSQMASGDIHGAADSFKKIVGQREGGEFASLDTLLRDAHYYLGEIYLTQQQYDAAVEELKAATDIDATDADGLWKLCEAYLGAGDDSAAVESCHKAVLMVPDFAEAYELLAQAHRNLGHELEAEYASAMVLYSSARQEEAIEELRAVIEEDPQFWDAYVGLGLALESSGQREEAINAFEQALAGDHENFLARLGVVRLGTAPEAGTIETPEVSP